MVGQNQDRSGWENPITGEALEINPAYEAEDAGVDTTECVEFPA